MSTTTNTKPLASLIEEFMKIVDTGNEEAAEDFLAKHIKEFPPTIQEKITYAFFSKALQEKAGTMEDTGKLQKEAIALFDEVQKAENVLEDQKKENDVRSKLGV